MIQRVEDLFEFQIQIADLQMQVSSLQVLRDCNLHSNDELNLVWPKRRPAWATFEFAAQLSLFVCLFIYSSIPFLVVVVVVVVIVIWHVLMISHHQKTIKTAARSLAR